MLRLLRKPLLSLVVLLALLLVGEVLVRALTNTEPPIVMRDATLGRRFLTSYDAEVYDEESEREVHVRTTRDGFRGPDRPYTPAPDTTRIAVLGDSMIAALAMEEAETLCGQLEARLNGDGGDESYEVLNFGVLGSSTAQEMLIYEQVAQRYEPDVVVLSFFSGNDLADNHRGLTSNPRIYFDLDEEGQLVQEPYSVSRSQVSAWLNRNSRLYVWQKQVLRNNKIVKADPAKTMRPADWTFASDPPPNVERAWEITAALIARLKVEVEANGARLVLLHVPGSKQICGDLYDAVVARAGEAGASFERDNPDTRAKEIAEALELPLLSLTPVLRAAAPSDSAAVQEEWLYYGGTMHWNERANALAAEALHAFLGELQRGA